MLELILIGTTSISFASPNPFHIRAVEKSLLETLLLENYKEEAIIWPQWSSDPVGLRVSFDYGFKVDYPISGNSFGIDFGENFVMYPARYQDDKRQYLQQNITEQPKTRVVVDFYPSFMQTYLTNLRDTEVPPRICYNKAIIPDKFSNSALKVARWSFQLKEESLTGWFLTLGASIFDLKTDLNFAGRMENLINSNRTITKDPNFLPSLFKSFQGTGTKSGYVNCQEQAFDGVTCFCKI